MEKGRSILLNAFWSSRTGWKNGSVADEDLIVAKNEGFMFDYPKVETHEQSMEKLKHLLAKIDPVDISNAFLYSLSTRALEYRSALGSYYYTIAIPQHERYGGYYCIKERCYICGWSQWKSEPSDLDKWKGLNVLNFERIKWGGVRHTNLDYALFDLEQFLKMPIVHPTSSDVDVFFRILDCVSMLEERQKAGKLRDVIIKNKILKTNKSEISVLLGELGICGVLSSSDYPCYEERFVDEYHRSPIENTNDFLYPINRWHAKDGINQKRLKKVFNL